MIDIPKDITANVTEYLPREAEFPPRKTQTITEEALSRAVEMIEASQKPFIYAGGGVVLSGASRELREFAEKVDAPVTDTLMGKGAFPGTDPRYTGMVGMHVFQANCSIPPKGFIGDSYGSPSNTSIGLTGHIPHYISRVCGLQDCPVGRPGGAEIIRPAQKLNTQVISSLYFVHFPPLHICKILIRLYIMYRYLFAEQFFYPVRRVAHSQLFHVFKSDKTIQQFLGGYSALMELGEKNTVLDKNEKAVKPKVSPRLTSKEKQELEMMDEHMEKLQKQIEAIDEQMEMDTQDFVRCRQVYLKPEANTISSLNL